VDIVGFGMERLGVLFICRRLVRGLCSLLIG
jgi:hypothetical protein